MVNQLPARKVWVSKLDSKLDLILTLTIKIIGITAEKMKFSTKDLFSKCNQILKKEILNGKTHILCSV